MRYEKGSFITIPNKHKLRELSLGARAIFMEMCDMADDRGLCFPSRSTLAKRIKKHENSVDSYITELCVVGILIKQTQTRNDGSYMSNLYQIIVIPLPASCDTPLPASCELTVPIRNSNHINSETAVSHVSRDSLDSPIQENSTASVCEEITIVDDIPSRQKPKKRVDEHILSIFRCFGKKYPKIWEMNTSQRKAAQLLSERNAEGVKKAIDFYEENKEDPLCPDCSTPWDLENKWHKLISYKKKNNL